MHAPNASNDYARKRSGARNSRNNMNVNKFRITEREVGRYIGG